MCSVQVYGLTPDPTTRNPPCAIPKIPILLPGHRFGTGGGKLSWRERAKTGNIAKSLSEAPPPPHPPVPASTRQHPPVPAIGDM